MEIIWYSVIALVLTIFFLLDGYDFGTGIIHLFFAEKEDDKVLIAKAAGLFWDANEVWLVAAGGLVFMAFPTFYASVFSGFYLPLNIVLWLIIFRAIGLELRSQFDYQMWKDIWDKAFGISSLLLALFFGVALGNVVRGVNLGGVENGVAIYEAHYFFLPLWNSEFSPITTHPGVIDWFTLIIGFISVITLSIHGANWIILKTNSSINKRLKKIIFYLALALSVLTLFSLAIWQNISPRAFENFSENPWMLFFPFIYLLGLTGLLFIQKVKNEWQGLLYSSLLIIGGIFSTLLSIFPLILPSTNSSSQSLSIYNTSASEYGLSVAIVWGIIGLILLLIYLLVQRKLTSGKVDEMTYGH
jgi:cytochrome d ubiquinol oxidase subunit II